MGATSALCSRGILLDRGRVAAAGPIQDVVAEYLASVREVSAAPIAERTDRGGEGGARVTDIALTDARGAPLRELISGQECLLVIGYGASRLLRRPVFKGTIYTSAGQPLLPINSALVDASFGGLAGSGYVACRLRRLPLSKGSYWMNVAIEDGGRLLDHVTGAYSFAVERGDFFGTGRTVEGLRDVCLVDQQWFAGREPRPAGIVARAGSAPE
jgi:lipopolysaccharide transport system ATP-binding protein